MEKRLKKVVVVLPFKNNKILMQLRDSKPGIDNPGKWGFFGGAIEEGEVPEETAEREVFEEIGCIPKTLNKIGDDLLPNGFLHVHSFYFFLDTHIDKLILGEGLDFGFFSLEEIMSKELYSSKLKKNVSVIPSNYLENTVKKVFGKIRNDREGIHEKN